MFAHSASLRDGFSNRNTARSENASRKVEKTNKNLTFFVNVEKTKLPDANSIGTSRRKSVSGFCNSSFFMGYEDFARCADETYKVGDYIVSFL